MAMGVPFRVPAEGLIIFVWSPANFGAEFRTTHAAVAYTISLGAKALGFQYR